MNYFLPSIRNKVAGAVAARLGADPSAVSVEDANPKIGADLAVPLFTFAATLKKAPAQIAQELAGGLELAEAERIEPAGGYLNIWLRPSAVAAGLADDRAAAADAGVPYGAQESGGRLAVIDFVSPNLAKPLSAGHLRNAFQGAAINNLLKATGWQTVTDNHIGDWGTVFGMWVVGFLNYSSDEQLEQGGVRELGRVYVEVRKELKRQAEAGETALREEIDGWLHRLEAGDEEAWAYHRRFSAISMEDMGEQLKQLGIVFDENLGESFYIERGKKMTDELLEQGIAASGKDGAVIVPLESEGIETPMLIRKSDGSALYATSDIATLAYREERWDPDLVVYVVGAEQKLVFRQLFAFARISGVTDAELVHHWYGLIEELDEDGRRRKMSSRSHAVYMADILERARTEAREIAPEGLGGEDVEAIALGAVAFREFAQTHTSNVLFDWDAMFDLHGFSGPYVQYAATRLRSILEKQGYEGGPLEAGEYDWSAESALLKHAARYPEAVAAAASNREGHIIAQYLYDLAREVNRYYENVSIQESEPELKAKRLALLAMLHDIFREGLGLLNIRLPGRM